MELERFAEEGLDALFRAVFEHSSEAVFVLDAAGRIVDLNCRAIESLGFAREELMGRSPLAFDACWHQAFPTGFGASLPSAEAMAFASSHRRKDGTTLPVQVRVVPVRQEGQRFALVFARDVSERRSAEEALQASEERFRTLVQLSFVIYWETDAEHRFTRQDYSPDLVDAPKPGAEIGKRRWDLPFLEPDENAWRDHRAAMDAHIPFADFELTRATAGGGKRYVTVSGFPVFDRGGRFLGYRGVGRHIGQLKRAEAEHRAHVWFLESMDRINRAIRLQPDVEGMASDVLQAAVEIFGCDRACLLGPCDPQAATWSAMAERTAPQCEAAFDARTDIAMEPGMADLFAAAKAASRPVLLVPEPVAQRFGVRAQMAMALPLQGAQPCLLALQQCSTARTWSDDEQHLFGEIGARLTNALTSRMAFRRLADSERRLEAAQRIAGVGWWERDFATGRILLSDESCRIFGVRPADMPQRDGDWLSAIHPEDRARAAAAANEAAAGGPRYDVEYRVVRPDGTVRMVHSQGDVTRDPSGRPVSHFGVTQDITLLRKAEQELRASEARFRTVFDRAMDAFFLLDAKLNVVDVNLRACESLGYSRNELVGMHPRQFDAALDESSIRMLAERVGTGETVTFETLHRRRDGTLFPVEIRTGTFQQGEHLLQLALVRDISERKLAEATVRAKDEALQATRLELARVSRVMTIGELTASIAHEVNQPLGAMVANAGAAVRWLSATPPNVAQARRVLQSIADDGRRASEIIQRIRALVQRRPPRMVLVGINETIGDVIALAQQELHSNGIALATRLSEDLPAVPGDRIQLQQVLLNLLVNAVEAMTLVGSGVRELTVSSRRNGAREVLVEVQDSGPGLAHEHADQVFEAFYTTKAEGLGIGLSISRSIIEAHGGRLWAVQNEPRGATFSFSLPLQAGAGA